MTSQYRCETCTNKRCVPSEPKYSEYRYDDVNYIRCLIDNRKVTPNEYDLICALGCASHSDFQNQREKVLDEFMNKIVSSRFALEDGMLIVRLTDVRNIREELRQGDLGGK